jgi:hypothetical protein
MSIITNNQTDYEIHRQIMTIFNSNVNSNFQHFYKFYDENIYFEIDYRFIFHYGNFSGIVNFFEFCDYSKIFRINTPEIQLKILRNFHNNKDNNVIYYVFTKLLTQEFIKTPFLLYEDEMIL